VVVGAATRRLTELIFFGKGLSQFLARETAIDGYRCFMEQYIKNKVAGAPPLKLPDGTLWE